MNTTCNEVLTNDLVQQAQRNLAARPMYDVMYLDDIDSPRGALLYAVQAESMAELPALLRAHGDGTLTDERLIKSVRQCINALTERVEDLEAIQP